VLVRFVGWVSHEGTYIVAEVGLLMVVAGMARHNGVTRASKVRDSMIGKETF
jgi:hypothetical protein